MVSVGNHFSGGNLFSFSGGGQMNNQLAVIQPEQFETTQRVAKAMVASGYFEDAKDVAQAVVKIMAGQEMGLPPFASMTNIHIIKGKPVLGANAMATLIKQHPQYDYKIKRIDATGCIITFFENGAELGDSSFTDVDAKAAGLGGNSWQKFPRNMHFARAMSNGAKWFTPGIFGGAPVYTPDELGAEVDDEGEIIIDVTPPSVDAKREGPKIEAVIQPWEITLVSGDDEPPDTGPLPDDEQVIADGAAIDFWTDAVGLIDRYTVVNHAQAAAKKLGFKAVPKSAAKRLEMYRALRNYAATRDAEEVEARDSKLAEQGELFEDELTGGAFAE